MYSISRQILIFEEISLINVIISKLSGNIQRRLHFETTIANISCNDHLSLFFHSTKSVIKFLLL
jgi:hypothetical protein